jgi:hypothetical protein
MPPRDPVDCIARSPYGGQRRPKMATGLTGGHYDRRQNADKAAVADAINLRHHGEPRGSRVCRGIEILGEI